MASSTVFPATSTHSTRYRAFLFRFERDRECGFGAAVAPSEAAAPFVGFPAAGFLPLLARPLLPPLAGGRIAWAAAVPSVALEVFFFTAGFGGGVFSGLSLSPLAEPISRSCTTGATIPVRNITSCVPIRIAEETTM